MRDDGRAATALELIRELDRRQYGGASSRIGREGVGGVGGKELFGRSIRAVERADMRPDGREERNAIAGSELDSFRRDVVDASVELDGRRRAVGYDYYVGKRRCTHGSPSKRGPGEKAKSRMASVVHGIHSTPDIRGESRPRA